MPIPVIDIDFDENPWIGPFSFGNAERFAGRVPRVTDDPSLVGVRTPIGPRMGRLPDTPSFFDIGGADTGADQGLEGIGTGIGSMFPLLENGDELDSLGPLFRTLLALQTGKGGGKDNDPFSLFSGIQL